MPSKASEKARLAKAAASACPHWHRRNSPYFGAHVSNDGTCELSYRGADGEVSLSPADALSLARWILDTFGEIGEGGADAQPR